MKRNFKFLGIIIFLFSCGQTDYQKTGGDVPTAGNVSLGIDLGDSLLAMELLDIFHQDYPNAHIKPVFDCEVALIRQLEMDSLRFVLMNRDFTKSEKENLEKRDIRIRSAKIAETSVAMVCNKSFPSDSVSYAQIRSYLESANSSAEMNILFDGSCGSVYQVIKNLFPNLKNNGGSIRSLNRSSTVLEYVSSHTNSIAFVNLNWIADRTEEISVNFRNSLKILKVENPSDKRYYFPFQSAVKLKKYPFIQQVYLHDLQGYSGLAQGFIAFTCSQPGQILVKKSGLVPAFDHGRTIVIESP